MILRLGFIALLAVLAFLAWRSWESRARFRVEQRKAWDEPLREGSAVILTASPAAWWWLLGLALLTAIAGRMLFERMAAGATVTDSFWNWLLFLVLAGLSAWRAAQLSERVTVTWDRIVSRNILGRRYSLPLSEVKSVDETDRTARLHFHDGRVLELSPWLEGRFWLARELKARLGD